MKKNISAYILLLFLLITSITFANVTLDFIYVGSYDKNETIKSYVFDVVNKSNTKIRIINLSIILGNQNGNTIIPIRHIIVEKIFYLQPGHKKRFTVNINKKIEFSHERFIYKIE